MSANPTINRSTKNNKKKQEKVLYQRPESPYWYFDTKDPVTGQRRRKSTKETDYKAALEVYKDYSGSLPFSYCTTSSNLKDLIEIYTDAEKNPRFKQAQIDGTRYGEEHALHVALYARQLLQILSQQAPDLLRKRLDRVSRLDVKNVKYSIVRAKGQCRQAQAIFQAFKTFLAQAADDGLMQTNPAVGMTNIFYEQKPRKAIENQIFAHIIKHPEIFFTIEDWSLFTVLATTGMRLSEVLALNREQIYKGTLTIDRAVKSSDKDDIGLPKWNLTRVIPLAKITQKALASIMPDFSGRYFHHSRSWACTATTRIRACLNGCMPDYKDLWSELTPHVLRHSLNTNLLCEGVEPIFVAEYLSWNHQALLSMQKRYTHIYANSLQPVADKIDELYTEKTEDRYFAGSHL